jgi:hypothetical protein
VSAVSAMKISLFSVLFVISATAVVQASGDDHSHSPHAKRSESGAVQPTSWPRSPLVWGDVNFIHTTDSHGEYSDLGSAFGRPEGNLTLLGTVFRVVTRCVCLPQREARPPDNTGTA